MKANDLYKPISEGVHDPHIFKAIFTAGAPGSGKSTVSHKVTAGSGLKTVDIDKFWHLFHRKNQASDAHYEKYWELAQKQKQNYLDGRLGVIIDGTGRVVDRIVKIKNRLDELGYDSLMIFVNTDLETAIQRALIRGEKTGRKMTPAFIKSYYEQVQNNLGTLQQIFAGRFLIIDNSKDHSDDNLKYAEKVIRNYLAAPPQNPIAHEWIKDQHEARLSKL